MRTTDQLETLRAESALAVGAPAIHVERLGYDARNDREICRVTIVRETATLWIDSNGGRWKKIDGSMYPQYVSPRFIVAVAVVTEAK